MPSLLLTMRSAALYLLVWFLLGLLLAAAISSASGAEWANSILFAVPTTLLYAIAVGFSTYYVCRAYPIAEHRAIALLGIFFSAAAIAGTLWAALCVGFNRLLQLVEVDWLGIKLSPALTLTLLALGSLLYLLACAVHFLLDEFERTRQLERSELEAKLAAQEAELRMLRTQIDPHFLFNSLNSISALTSANPAGARQMTLLLADFFRRSLSFEAQRKIQVAQEMSLIDDYLAIEKIRFGQRLTVVRELEEGTQQFLLPPMILQPLVENALKHGIANLMEGGTIRIHIAQQEHLLRISVENEVDLDQVTSNKPGRRGIGLANVRQRLQNAYAHEASVHWRASPGLFRVEMTLPIQQVER
ncbi:MAG: histidine kinase [Burkholderiales bacterium]|nr:histidine kinase [Burkholderiales bacterium]